MELRVFNYSGSKNFKTSKDFSVDHDFSMFYFRQSAFIAIICSLISIFSWLCILKILAYIRWRKAMILAKQERADQGISEQKVQIFSDDQKHIIFV